MPPTSTASGRMRCNRAAEDKTNSQSGRVAVRFGILHPEVVALGIRVRNIRTANLHNFVQQAPISQHCPAQIGPVLPATPGDHIVNSGRGEALMIKVAMKHERRIFL